VTGPASAVAATRLAVRTELALLPEGAIVLVGCSGGPDSLALAGAVGFEAPERGIKAAGLVVDHRLQAGSQQVAEAAAQQCRDLGLDPVDVRTVRVVLPAQINPTTRARAVGTLTFDGTRLTGRIDDDQGHGSTVFTLTRAWRE